MAVEVNSHLHGRQDNKMYTMVPPGLHKSKFRGIYLWNKV